MIAVNPIWTCMYREHSDEEATIMCYHDAGAVGILISLDETPGLLVTGEGRKPFDLCMMGGRVGYVERSNVSIVL